jgi:hypothetical protein
MNENGPCTRNGLVSLVVVAVVVLRGGEEEDPPERKSTDSLEEPCRRARHFKILLSPEVYIAHLPKQHGGKIFDLLYLALRDSTIPQQKVVVATMINSTNRNLKTFCFHYLAYSVHNKNLFVAGLSSHDGCFS